MDQSSIRDSGKATEYVENAILTLITKENVMKEFKQKNWNKNLKNNKDGVNKAVKLNPNMLNLKEKNNYYKRLLKPKMTEFVSFKKN